MSLIGRLIKHQGGASAVEFALIAPALIAMYFGIAELSQGMMSSNKTGEVASSIGDLATQNSCLTNAQVSDIFSIGTLLIKPFASSGLTMRLSSLTSNASTGTVKVDWSDGNGMAALGVGSTQSVPSGLIQKGQTVILAEANYKYTSPVNIFVSSNGVTFSKRYYLRPRKSDSITRVTTTCT